MANVVVQELELIIWNRGRLMIMKDEQVCRDRAQEEDGWNKLDMDDFKVKSIRVVVELLLDGDRHVYRPVSDALETDRAGKVESC
ncbi:unnamed protein product [Ambrosiozyma monospora]|uniref:Unnamed protein product n=1 Tax=Ambrosiozyma monospora TaxID=43982 RepID=A0A9W6YTD5_AMBMO|nr:unnamed protein product [Ambrosiozyma monospora]